MSEHAYYFKDKSSQELVEILNSSTLAALIPCGAGSVITSGVAILDSIPAVSALSHFIPMFTPTPHGIDIRKRETITQSQDEDSVGTFEYILGSTFGSIPMTAANLIEAGLAVLRNKPTSYSKIRAGFYSALTTQELLMGEGTLCDDFILEAEAARTILDQRGQLSKIIGN